MRLKKPSLAATIAMAFALAGCSGTATQRTPSLPTSAPQQSSTPDVSTGSSESVAGTVVRFTAGTATVDVTVGEDSSATRDFLNMLPLTITLEELSGREKIADLPRKLSYEGSPGSDPEDGDLIYYTPWQNLGFYYNASGIGHTDQTIHLGRYDATAEELARFEGQQTTVEIVDGP